MLGLAVLKLIYHHFSDDPYRFEAFAADVWLMSDERVASVDVTRPTRDGGRDAIGEYLLGPESDPIRIDFALEAKCYGLGNGVGVREVSRLISRLRARQFGILVTTSYLADQAYQEIRSDGHPIVVISGRDIVEILSRVGLRTVAEVDEYLRVNHPRETAGAFSSGRAACSAPRRGPEHSGGGRRSRSACRGRLRARGLRRRTLTPTRPTWRAPSLRSERRLACSRAHRAMRLVPCSDELDGRTAVARVAVDIPGHGRRTEVVERQKELDRLSSRQ